MEGVTHVSPSAILKRHLKAYLGPILAGLVCLMVVDILQLLIPLVLKEAINQLTRPSLDPKAFLRHPINIMLLAIAIGVFRYLWRYFILGQARALERDLRRGLYDHLQRLPMHFFSNHSIGDMMARATNDLNAIRMAGGMGFVALVDGILLGLASIIFMASISPKLTLLCLIPMPMVAILTRLLTEKMGKGFEASQRDFASLTERVRECILGIRTLKAFSQEQWGAKRVEEAGQRYLMTNLTLSRYLGLFLPMTGIFTNVSLCVLIAYGGRETVLGEMDPGGFVAFLSYLGLLTWPIMAIGWVMNLFQRGRAALVRVSQVMGMEKEALGPQGVQVPGADAIRIKDLKYSYGNQFSLKIPELTIPMGKTTAVVGRVAAGKTTLINLITRILEPPPGTVLWGGLDSREIPLKGWRTLFGYATQDVVLFSDTITENIRFGRGDRGPGYLQELLSASGLLLDRDLQQDPERFLKELGQNVSGGQRQRITIARALYEDPPILILDDALSMVDVKTEMHIIDALTRLRKGKTNIIVTHRPSVLRKVDYIYVLDSGRLVEHGSPHDLLLKKGIFYSLYLKEKVTG
jgi:ATP-binding cassette subfamily B protein